MKNISIRKGIGFFYLGLTMLFISSIYSVYSQHQVLLEDYLALSVKTALLVIAPLCLLFCLFSSIFWLFTQSLLPRFLGYINSLLILLMCITGFTIEDYVSTISGIALGVTVFMFFISYSEIGFSNKKEKYANNKTLDSQLLEDDNSTKNKLSYFWFLHRIYAITIFSCVFPFLLQALYYFDTFKGIQNWEFGIILLLHTFVILFWIKPKWGKWIFVVMASIGFLGSLFFLFSRIFDNYHSKVVAIFGGVGLCLLPFSLLLILISKEAQAELKAFENKKN